MSSERSRSATAISYGAGDRFSTAPGAALTALAAAMSLMFAPSAAAQFVVPKGGVASGDKLFAQQCAACHSVVPEQTRVGPSLAGVIGRRAGKQPRFAFSAALKASAITWTPATMDRWLTDSNKAVPGSAMNYRQPDAAKRERIIAYLQTLKSGAR